MTPSPEELLAIARSYWRSDHAYDHVPEHSPESSRLHARWEQELEKLDRWRAFLHGLRQELPGFTLGDATATADACFRCAAYADSGCPRPTFRFVVVGCISILAPLYTLYGVRYEFIGRARHNPQVSFEPLPPEMRPTAEVIARGLEAKFRVRALPPESTRTPVPLIVDWMEPPNTTLFHALFTSRPDSLP
jgi:hypothetical protein